MAPRLLSRSLPHSYFPRNKGSPHPLRFPIFFIPGGIDKREVDKGWLGLRQPLSDIGV